jgi:hypothetical protein
MLSLNELIISSQAWWLMPVVLVTQEVVEMERMAVLGQFREKLVRSPNSVSKSWAWWYTPVIPAT